VDFSCKSNFVAPRHSFSWFERVLCALEQSPSDCSMPFISPDCTLKVWMFQACKNGRSSLRSAIVCIVSLGRRSSVICAWSDNASTVALMLTNPAVQSAKKIAEDIAKKTVEEPRLTGKLIIQNRQRK
jgi:hypothetical protein